MNSISPIRFGLIGMGHIGKRHAHHIESHPDASLVAFADIDPRQQWPGVESYTDYRALLQREDIDVITVCTPNYLHPQHTIDSLKAGKHVVIEKPVSLTTSSCDEMIETAIRYDRKLFAVKQNRYNPPVAAVKKLIQNNQLGTIFSIQVNAFWNRNEAYYQQSAWRGDLEKDGGCLFTQFSHFIDILYYLNPYPIQVHSGIIHNYLHRHSTSLHEDTGSFLLSDNKGSLINFNFTTCSHAQNMEGSITLFGEKGTIKIGGQYLNTIAFQSIQDQEITLPSENKQPNDYGFYKGSMSNHDKVIENVVNHLRHGEPMTTTMEDAREVIRIIEDMYACALDSKTASKKNFEKTFR